MVQSNEQLRQIKDKLAKQLTAIQTAMHTNWLCKYLFFIGCGTVINLATYKDHSSECKAKLSKVRIIMCICPLLSIDVISKEFMKCMKF